MASDRRFGRFAFGAAFVLWTTSAMAQAPSAAERESARNHMDEGDKQRDSGDLKAALKSYEAADTIMKVPTTGIDVAKTLIALGRLVEAREALNQMLGRPAKPGEPAPFTAARKTGEALANDLGVRIPSLQVAVNAPESQAPQITIDGEPIPNAALATPRKVNPGSHTIVARLGTTTRTQEVNLSEHETKVVNIDLKGESGAPPPSNGATPDHKVSTSDGSMFPILMYAGFATAGVGLAVGGITGLMSISQTSSLRDVCPANHCAANKQGDIDSARSLGDVSTVAFVVAGLGLGAGLVGLVLSPRAPKEPAARSARAIVTPSYVGLAGTF